MKNTFLILFLFITTTLLAQGEGTGIDLGGKILVGEVSKKGITVLVNSNDFMREINRSLYDNKNVMTKMEVLSDVSPGEKKIQYYYIKLSSNDGRNNLVKMLFNRNGKLYIDKSENPVEYIYFACEGNAGCEPRMFEVDGELVWSCREFLGCVTSEQAEKDKCSNTKSAF